MFVMVILVTLLDVDGNKRLFLQISSKDFILKETETQGSYFYFQQQLVRRNQQMHCHWKSPSTDERIVQQRYRFPQRTFKLMFYCEYEIDLKNECCIRCR